MSTTNLKPKKPLPAGMVSFDSAGAKLLRPKSQEARWATRAAAEVFKLNAKAFITTMNDLPEISPLDVMKMAIHSALAAEDFEAAAKYASQLAEYQTPKLARLESNVTTTVQDMSDEELRKIAIDEHLIPHLQPSPVGTDS